MNKYTKKEIFFTYLKFYFASFRTHFFTYFVICPVICSLVSLFNYNKAEKMLENFDNFFLSRMDNYFDMAVKIEEIKHPDWFISNKESDKL